MKKNKLYICLLIFILVNIVYQPVSFATNKIIESTTKNDISSTDILESQVDSLNISQFINEAKKYSSDVFDDINFSDLFNSALSGNLDNKQLGKSILNILGKETLTSIRVIASIIVIIIIHSILKSIGEGLENKGIAQITFYVQYILIVTLIMVNFTDVINMVKDSVNNLIGFSNSLIPLLITLILSTGSIASANLLQPILLFLITFIGNFVNSIIIPIVLVSTALSIVSKISDKIQLDKLSKFFKSSVIWILGVILTLFVGLVSLEGTLSSSVDGITAKTAKAAVSSFVPVVGKILGDAVDTVIGCTTILKNAVGILGVVVIIGICILPILKLLTLMTTYYIGSAICEPIADKKIIELLSQVGDTFKILLGIICSISVMLIIGVTLVVKISNTGLMYR